METTTEQIQLRRVGVWLLEWQTNRPHTVWVSPEWSKTKTRADSGILYENGTMAWNYPEYVPNYVKAAALSFITKCRKEVAVKEGK